MNENCIAKTSGMSIVRRIMLARLVVISGLHHFNVLAVQLFHYEDLLKCSISVRAADVLAFMFLPINI